MINFNLYVIQFFNNGQKKISTPPLKQKSWLRHCFLEQNTVDVRNRANLLTLVASMFIRNAK